MHLMMGESAKSWLGVIFAKCFFLNRMWFSNELANVKNRVHFCTVPFHVWILYATSELFEYALLSHSGELIHLKASLCRHALSRNLKNYIVSHTKSNHFVSKNATLVQFLLSSNVHFHVVQYSFFNSSRTLLWQMMKKRNSFMSTHRKEFVNNCTVYTKIKELD